MSAARTLPLAVERMAIFALGLAAIYASLVPFGSNSGPTMPDLTFCLVAAWVIRRPATAPLWMVLLLGLLGDFMMSRPPGLGALGLLLASERLRANAGSFHGGAFVLEWLAVVAAFAGVLALMQLGLLFVFVQGPQLDTLIGYLVTTALAYPVVVAVLQSGLGIRRPQSGRDYAHLGRLR